MHFTVLDLFMQATEVFTSIGIYLQFLANYLVIPYSCRAILPDFWYDP